VIPSGRYLRLFGRLCLTLTLRFFLAFALRPGCSSLRFHATLLAFGELLRLEFREPLFLSLLPSQSPLPELLSRSGCGFGLRRWRRGNSAALALRPRLRRC
jgi:hypothetical protein